APSAARAAASQQTHGSEARAQSPADTTEPAASSGSALRAVDSTSTAAPAPPDAAALAADGPAEEQRRASSTTPSSSQPHALTEAMQAASVARDAPRRASADDAAEEDASSTRSSAKRVESPPLQRLAPSAEAPTHAPAASPAASPTLALKLTQVQASAYPQPGAPSSSQPDAAASALLHRGLQAALSQRGGALTLRLNPPSLGSVKIDMSLQQGAVSVSLQASTPQAQQLLEQHAQQLRLALESRGLEVHRLETRLAPPTPSSRHDAEQHQQQHQSPADDPSSQKHRDRSLQDEPERREHDNHSVFRFSRTPLNEEASDPFLDRPFSERLQLSLSTVA
ncbi:MAG: flagellar hook-length control protein FliK, partial [Planctomycetota bacterium]